MPSRLSGKVLRTGLALSLAAGLNPAAPVALAVEPATDTYADEQGVTYTPIYEKDEIVAAFQNGGYYELRGNVTLDESLSIPAGVSVVLNLKGYYFDLASNKINVTGALNIVNVMSGGYDGAILGEKDVINVLAGGSFTINGGCSVEASTGSAVKLAYRDNVSFTMNGGRLTSPATTVNAMKGAVSIMSGTIETTSEKSSHYAISNQYGDAMIQIGNEGLPDSEIYISSIQNPRSAEIPLIIKSGTIGKIAPTVKDFDELSGRFVNDLSDIMPQGLCCVPVEEDGATFYRVAELSVETAGAQIGSKYYASAVTAAKELSDGETLTLLKDVTGSSDSVLLDIDARNATVDLAGHSVVNNGSGFGIEVTNPYGSDISECTATIKNSSDTPASITANIPLSFETGDSRYAITAQIDGDIALNSTNAETPQAFSLGSGAKLAYSESAAKAYGNGGFMATDADGNSYIFGTYASALDIDADAIVQMLNDYNGSAFIASGDRQGTLDLSGHTFTTSAVKVADVNYDGASLSILNGSIVGSSATGDGIMMLNSDTMLRLEGVTVTLAGDGFALVTNGNEQNNSIELVNSSFDNKNGAGIYFPSSGSVTIDNSSISAKYMGVQVCAGDLDIKDGTVITVTGEPVQKTENDGPIYDGAAVSVVNREGYQGIGKVSIAGGSFTSADGVDAVKAYSFNNTDKVEGDWESAPDFVDITGGVFTSSPRELMEAGFVAQVSEGMFTVIKKENLGAGEYEAAPGDSISEKDFLPGLIVTTDPDTGRTVASEPIPEYSISATASSNGLTHVSASKAKEGEVVTITATPNSGFKIGSVVVRDGAGTQYPVNSTEDGTFTFTMPASNVNVSVAFLPVEVEVVKHDITLTMTSHGAAKTNVSKAAAGEVVTLDAVPAKGYKVKSIIITSGTTLIQTNDTGDGSWWFTMPDGDVDIYVSFAEDEWYCSGQEDCPTFGYADVADDAWYHQAVDWAVGHNVMIGHYGYIVPVFDPDGEITRAQMAQVFYNMVGKPDVDRTEAAKFSDCDAAAWYAPAIAWAVGEGLFQGYGNEGTFGPDDVLTREQAALVLMRVAEKNGQDVSERDDLGAFPDADAVSDWASDALAWAVAEDIVRGVEEEGKPTTLAPQGTATRAQAAALMMRLVDAGFLELSK